MKSNAIVRIVIWSLVIVLLVGILCAGLGLTRYRARYEVNAEPLNLASATASHDPDGSDYSATAVIGTPQNIRETPSHDGEVCGQLNAGDSVTLQRVETIGGERWGYLEEPATGWITLDSVSEFFQEEMPSVDADPAGVWHMDAGMMDSLKIVWPLGGVRIVPQEDDNIVLKVSGAGEDTNILQCSMKGTQLTVRDSRFPKNEINFLGITLHNYQEMALTVCVPKGWECQKLKIESASGEIFVSGLTIREAELDSASSQVNFSDCRLGELDVDTASGDITFTGSLEELNFDAASADFRGVLTNCPRSIDMDSASGNLDLTLPADCGFSVKLDSMSGRFSSDFKTEIQGKRYVCGDGACEIDVDAMSGDVKIRMAAEVTETQPTAADCTVPDCTDPDHGHEVPCTVPNCTDPAHGHDTACTVPNCTDASHGHNEHDNGHH